MATVAVLVPVPVPAVVAITMAAVMAVVAVMVALPVMPAEYRVAVAEVSCGMPGDGTVMTAFGCLHGRGRPTACGHRDQYDDHSLQSVHHCVLLVIDRDGFTRSMAAI
jgi:hypothetical protein